MIEGMLVKENAVPPEFAHLLDREKIPWDRILVDTQKRKAKGKGDFEAFTDATIAYKPYSLCPIILNIYGV